MSRELIVEPVPHHTFYQIVYVGGGEVADALKGTFTNRATAERTLAIWKAQQKARPAEEKPDSEKDIIELLTTKRPKGRPPNASKR